MRVGRVRLLALLLSNSASEATLPVVEWAAANGCSDDLSPVAVAAGTSGIYVAGYNWDVFTFSSPPNFSPRHQLAYPYGQTGYLTKMDMMGNVEWAGYLAMPDTWHYVEAIALEPTGSLSVIGNFDSVMTFATSGSSTISLNAASGSIYVALFDVIATLPGESK